MSWETISSYQQHHHHQLGPHATSSSCWRSLVCCEMQKIKSTQKHPHFTWIINGDQRHHLSKRTLNVHSIHSLFWSTQKLVDDETLKLLLSESFFHILCKNPQSRLWTLHFYWYLFPGSPRLHPKRNWISQEKQVMKGTSLVLDICSLRMAISQL